MQNNKPFAEKLKTDYWLYLLGLIGVLTFIAFYPKTFPWATISIKSDRAKIFATAKTALPGYELQLADFHRRLEFKIHDLALEYLERTYGLEKTNHFLENDLPLYYWQIQWRGPEVKPAKKQNPAGSIDSVISSRWVNSVTVFMSQQGLPLGYSLEVKEDAIGAQLNREQAEHIANAAILRQFKEKTNAFALENYQLVDQKKRTLHQFTYKQEPLVHGLAVKLELEVIGNRISKFALNFNPPEDFKSEDKDRYEVIAFVIGFMILFVSFILIMIRKLRADEINFKFGLPFAILGVINMVMILLPNLESDNILEFLIPLITAPVFMGVFILLAASVGEAVTRETWSNKLLTIDTLFRGRVFHQEFGLALLRGIAIGFFLVGLISVVLQLFQIIEPVSFTKRNEFTRFITAAFPFLNLISTSIYNTLWSQFIYVLFFSAFLARWFRFKIWIIITVAFVWALLGGSPEMVQFNPIWMRLLSGYIFSVLLLFFFFRYDFLTGFIGQLTYQTFFIGYPLFFYGQNFYVFNAILLMAVPGLFLIFGIIGLRHYVDPEELQEYVPSFVRQLRERERLRRELEVARKVQLSFLPAEVPRIPGLDIATICIPAMEVGGDYYDFVKLSDERLGIVVGDVSGKGISAAFYMTLTKGFLKSQAKYLQSPRETLIRINELFYENVARGHFISMIYGIFDMKQRTFTFARAGHNPLIIHRNRDARSEVLCPRGLALGLERGQIFEKNIDELAIDLHFKDIFVFYTDGFSEAMDKNNQEFGEDRLVELVKSGGHMTTDDLMKRINEKITDFVGKKQQHDDMTMVIVKVA